MTRDDINRIIRGEYPDWPVSAVDELVANGTPRADIEIQQRQTGATVVVVRGMDVYEVTPGSILINSRFWV